MHLNATSKLSLFLFIISVAVALNLLCATVQNFVRESNIQHFGFPDIQYFSSLTCAVGTLLFLICCVQVFKRDMAEKILFFFSVLIITAGTLAAGSITYTGEDAPSFIVVFLFTSALLIPSIAIIFKRRKKSLLTCALLLYSPTLSFYSAYQWVDWNTKLFAPEVTKIQGWNFKVSEWKWIDLEKIQPKDVIVYNWSPLFRRFAVKTSAYDYLDDRETADILFNVEMINGKLLITDATHVWWQSSGETGVWPTR